MHYVPLEYIKVGCANVLRWRWLFSVPLLGYLHVPTYPHIIDVTTRRLANETKIEAALVVVAAAFLRKKGADNA